MPRLRTASVSGAPRRPSPKQTPAGGDPSRGRAAGHVCRRRGSGGARGSLRPPAEPPCQPEKALHAAERPLGGRDGARGTRSPGALAGQAVVLSDVVAPGGAYVAGMSTGASSSAPADVIILGGGVAALEAMMALRELAGDRVRVSLVSAAEDFVERPMSVAEPFGLATVRRYPLREIAADFGARVRPRGGDRRGCPRAAPGVRRWCHAGGLDADPGARRPDARPLPSGDHVRTRGCRRGRARARGRPRARRGPACGLRGAEPGRLDAAACTSWRC